MQQQVNIALPAHFYGKSLGNTFEEAIENFKYPNDITDWEGKVVIKKDSPLSFEKQERWVEDKTAPLGRSLKTIYVSWACRFFDNEADARRSFG